MEEVGLEDVGRGRGCGLVEDDPVRVGLGVGGIGVISLVEERAGVWRQGIAVFCGEGGLTVHDVDSDSKEEPSTDGQQGVF